MSGAAWPPCPPPVGARSRRAGSSNAAVLRTIQELAAEGVETELYERLATLPHFNPDDDYAPLDPAVVDMRAAIAASDASMVGVPNPSVDAELGCKGSSTSAPICRAICRAVSPSRARK